ncbi:hypothetical protein [Haladaptatus sp. R4]|uniref:hypothetical protein n=1 Tax=Haladaptatus sp. R4 TaxID=1679489 RepID=UPI001CBF1928|nr:hypothetical protein [Haladaptatus sp. R4]
MEYTTLGDTGVTVSKICPGCMDFGNSWGGETFDWTVGEEPSEPVEMIGKEVSL